MRVSFEYWVPEGRPLTGWLLKRSIFIVCCGLLLMAAPRLQAQDIIHVVGHVVSDSGQSVAKATIVVKGDRKSVV